MLQETPWETRLKLKLLKLAPFHHVNAAMIMAGPDAMRLTGSKQGPGTHPPGTGLLASI